jgi:hypothetical protein
MNTRTLRIITLWFCLLFGVVWVFLSVSLKAMYVPPGEVQAFMVALIGGKWAQSYVEKRGGGGAT